MKAITSQQATHAKKLVKIFNKKAQDTWKSNPKLSQDYDIAMQTIKYLLDKVYTEQERTIFLAENILCDSGIGITTLIKNISKHKDQNELIDNIQGILVWEPLQDRYTCAEFLEQIYQ